MADVSEKDKQQSATIVYRCTEATADKALNKLIVDGFTITSAIATALAEQREQLIDLIPTSWLDSLLTGPDAVLKGNGGTWGCPDIERLLRAIQERIRAGGKGGE